MTNDNDQSKSLSITAIGKRIELEKNKTKPKISSGLLGNISSSKYLS